MRRPFSSRRSLQVEADVLENAAHVAQFLTARWRCLRQEIEDLAILQAVVGKPRDAPILVEVDRDDPLIDHRMRHESDGALGFLGDVVERVAVDRSNRGRRAENDQHLLLGGADGNLFQRTLRQHVAALQSFLVKAAGRKRHCASDCQREAEFSTTHGFRTQTRQFHFRTCIGKGVDVIAANRFIPRKTR